MRKELDYFMIDDGLGWNQHGFRDWSMYFGGCAAVSACDLCIYLARQKGMALLYPYDADRLSREEYLAFSKTMKRYLMPRLKGIDTLHLYSSGLLHYWRDMGADSLDLVKASGTVPLTEARELIREQIDSDMLVPFLLLLHKNRSFRAYQWHWFNLAGYEEREGDFYVKAITYGSFRWLSLTELWETGHRRKGGFIRILG